MVGMGVGNGANLRKSTAQSWNVLSIEHRLDGHNDMYSLILDSYH